MAVKTPIKATFTGSDVTGLAEYQAADFIGVADGGTGAVTFSAGILTADGTNAFTTVSAPSGTIVGTSDTQTLTNKTIDASNNTISNIGVSSLTTSSFTLVDDSSTSTTISLGETLKVTGSGGITSSLSGDTLTIAVDGTIVTESSSDTLTNKTIDSANNTLTLDLSEGTLTGTTSEFNTALSDGSFATLAGTETLTNKTISGSSNTLSNIGNSSLTNSSITIVDDSSTSATISLGETLKIAGTSNEVNTSISGDTVTIGLPDSVSITSNLTVGGNLTVNGTTTTVNSTTIEITNSFTFEGSTADAYETVLGVVDPTADRTINLPDASGTIVLADTTDTLTNKTINTASNTITIVEADISDLQSYITASSTDTLTNKTISGANNTITGLNATSIADGSISNTEFQYLNGVSSNIQTQLDAKATNAFAIAQAVALG